MTNSFSDNFRMCETAITRFITTLLPLHQVGAAIPDDKFALIVIHTLAHAALISLHFPFMRDNNVSRQKCLRSARSVILVIKHIAEADFDYLDPILGVRLFFHKCALNMAPTENWPAQYSPAGLVPRRFSSWRSRVCRPRGLRSTYWRRRESLVLFFTP